MDGTHQPRSQSLSSLPPLVVGSVFGLYIPTTKGGREEGLWERSWERTGLHVILSD